MCHTSLKERIGIVKKLVLKGASINETKEFKK